MLSTSFDPKAIVFGGVEKNKKGGKIVYLGLGAGGKERISIETPAMVMPFGVTPYQDSAGGEIQSYSLDASFRTADVDPRVADFQKRVESLDELLIQVATDNSAEWFGKKVRQRMLFNWPNGPDERPNGPNQKRILFHTSVAAQMNKELITEFYRPLINARNPNYPPVLKVKCSVDLNGQPSAQFFDETPAHKPVSIEYLGKGCTTKMIVELSSLWFVNKTFGATFRLAQAAVVTKPRRLQGYAFATDDATPTDAPADAPAPTEM